MQYKTVGSPDSPITGAKWQTIQQNNSKLSIKNPLLKNVLSLWSPIFKKVAEKEQKNIYNYFMGSLDRYSISKNCEFDLI